MLPTFGNFLNMSSGIGWWNLKIKAEKACEVGPGRVRKVMVVQLGKVRLGWSYL